MAKQHSTFRGGVASHSQIESCEKLLHPEDAIMLDQTRRYLSFLSNTVLDG